MSTDVSAATKFFTAAQNGFQTTLASTIASGATTVPLNSVAGYTNGDSAVMVVDPTGTTTKQVFTGVVDTSGVQLTGVVWTAGTNQTHNSGTVVVDYTTATHWDLLLKGIKVQHAVDGTHGAVTATSVAATGNISSSAGSVTAAAGLTATGTIAFNGLSDGWIGANESWTYASATTITVPTDATTKYAVGDRIKLTQTTVKYFYIVGVAATTLTITGGADYTLINAAISLNYYSHMATPLGFPQWFNYTETWTGFSAAPSGGNSRFSIMGRTVSYHTNRTTVGTSSTTAITLTLPVTAATQTGGWSGMSGRAFDNGSENTAASLYLVASGAVTAGLFLNNGSNWTAASTKDWRGMIVYEI